MCIICDLIVSLLHDYEAHKKAYRLYFIGSQTDSKELFKCPDYRFHILKHKFCSDRFENDFLLNDINFICYKSL